MKKTVTLLLVIALLIPFSLSAVEKTGEQWNLHIGSAIYVSQLGVSRDIGQWEFGLNVDSGFPNVALISLAGESDEGETKAQQFWEALKGSLTLAYGGDIYAKFDVIPSDAFDLDLSAGIAGIYTDIFDVKITAAFAEAGMRLAWNFNEHNGIYAETNVPIYTLLVTKNSSSGETEVHGTFLFSGDDGLATLLTITGLCCTRIGYRISF